jgi:hypothetical protein
MAEPVVGIVILAVLASVFWHDYLQRGQTQERLLVAAASTVFLAGFTIAAFTGPAYYPVAGTVLVAGLVLAVAAARSPDPGWTPSFRT